MENTHKFFKRGFDDTAAGAVEAGIEFLWTQRSVGSDTAFQKGVFRYWSKAGGIDYMQYTPFEVVLVKGKTGWKLLTQKQAKAITKEQWDALVDKKKNKKESQLAKTAEANVMRQLDEGLQWAPRGSMVTEARVSILVHCKQGIVC